MADTESRLSAVIALVIGVTLVGAGFLARAYEARERATLTETTGTIVDTVKGRVRDSNGKDRDGFAPVIEFQVNGAPVRFTGAVENFRQSNGNAVAIRYDPAQPAASARVVGGLQELAPWAVFILGGFSLLSGLRGLIRSRVRG